MTSSWIHDDGAQPQRLLGDCTVARQHNMVGGVDVVGCVRSCRLHSTIGVCSCSRVRAGDVFKLLAQSRSQFIAQNGRHEHRAHRSLLSIRTGIQYEQQFNSSSDIFQLHICVRVVFYDGAFVHGAQHAAHCCMRTCRHSCCGKHGKHCPAARSNDNHDNP